MRYSRRQTMAMTGAALAGAAISRFASGPGFAQETMMDTLALADGIELGIHPVNHASLSLSYGELELYFDPVGEPAAYEGLRRPDVIFVTHEHPDHFNADTLAALAADETALVTNPAVFGMLPADLQTRATALGNGDSAVIAGLDVEAVPAYNTTADRLRYHPQGRDNGYVLELGGSRVYIAGDTEDIPEMRALTDIALAFLPMNLPFTMDIDQAAGAVAAFEPAVIYPYHYRGSDTAAFKAMVENSGAATEVRLHDWYA